MAGSPVAGVVASAATGVARKAIKNYTGYGKPKKGKEIKKTAKNVAKAVLPPVLDVLPGLAGLAGSAYGGPATGTAAQIMGKLGREGIRHITGYGKPKKGKGIKKVVQKALPHVLDVAVPAVFS